MVIFRIQLKYTTKRKKNGGCHRSQIQQGGRAQLAVALFAGTATSSSVLSLELCCLRRLSSTFASCMASQSFASDMICRERSSTAGSALSSSRLFMDSSISSPLSVRAGKLDRFLPQPKNLIEMKCLRFTFNFIFNHQNINT